MKDLNRQELEGAYEARSNPVLRDQLETSSIEP